MAEHSPAAFPAELEELRTLAYNLRWSWHAETRELFRRVSPTLWAPAQPGVGAVSTATPQPAAEATSTGLAQPPLSTTDASEMRPLGGPASGGSGNPVRLLAEVPRARLEEVARDESFRTHLAGAAADLDAYLNVRDTWFRRAHGAAAAMRVAYFSAEFGIAACLPIYAGGLGVLAGDHLKSASDLGLPLIGVGLFYGEGYFRQRLGRDGRQGETYVSGDPARLPLTLERTSDGGPLLATVPFRDRDLRVRVWRADVGRVPLYLLDTDVEGNAPDDRRITDRLYGGDAEHRLRQEIVLGIGGMRVLAALGIAPTVIHLNEGHAAFAAVERAHHAARGHASFAQAAERLARSTVFTTHTPVPAGHDRFGADLLEHYLGDYVRRTGERWDRFLALGRDREASGHEPFCMTTLALRLSRRRNAVSRLHGAVSRTMWRGFWPDRTEAAVPIGHITNGVHLPTWVAPAMSRVYAAHVAERWREQVGEVEWQRASSIPPAELWAARREQRGALVARARLALAVQAERRGERAGWAEHALDPDTLTVVFARRFATYKRATLILADRARLTRLLTAERPVQFVFAGKPHPKDEPGKDFLRQIAAFAAPAAVRRRFVFLEDYDIELARILVQGADVWLNVPLRPHEASGTSGMKAAANGALNLSVLDGWWAEAWHEHNHLPDPIGWAIDGAAATRGERRRRAEWVAPSTEKAPAGPDRHDPAEPTGSWVGTAAAAPQQQDRADAEALFTLLESQVVPLFYERDEAGLPIRWLEHVRSSIRQVVPFFNTNRMVRDYLDGAYLPAEREAVAAASR